MNARRPQGAKERAGTFPRGRGSAVRFAPSVLSADLANLAGATRALERAGLHWIHLDIMDGHFVPNLTFGPPVVRWIREASQSAFLDAHLMVESPARYFKELAAARAQLITVHQEALDGETPAALRAIRRLGAQAGVSIKPKTPVSALDSCLDFVDLVLVMTVEPGFGGQRLIPSALNKIRQLALERETRRANFLIQVDGGINAETAPLAVAAGADVLVAGSAIFREGRIRENLRALRASLRSLQ